MSKPTVHELVSQLAQFLIKHHFTMSTAESCTGGMVAAALTELSGSSAWFERGFVTYSNTAKHQHLGVPMEMIQTYGAVSLEVAKDMAIGAMNASGSDLALAITGVAGPTGGSIEKPVGFVCFGWALKHKGLIKADSESVFLLSTKEIITDTTRSKVRELAVHHSLYGMMERLQKSF